MREAAFNRPVFLFYKEIIFLQLFGVQRFNRCKSGGVNRGNNLVIAVQSYGSFFFLGVSWCPFTSFEGRLRVLVVNFFYTLIR